jgi:glucokinase
MKRTLMLGLDLGGTKIAAGVVSRSGHLLSAVRVTTPARGVKRDLAALFDAAHSAVATARVRWKDIRAVGVGVPGAFNPKTETVWAPNLPGWAKVPLRHLLERAFGRPVFVEGDRNVQALAEAWLGAGRGARDLVFLTVGTGIGAGIISEGRIVRGSHGVAGAVGWMAITGHWRPHFARLGSLEAQAAGPAIARMARLALQTRSSGALGRCARSEEQLTAETVVRAARQGDARARRILTTAGDSLGRGVASIVALLNPNLFVIGGGLAEAGELLLAPLRQAAKKWGQPLASRQVRIVRTRLGENIGVLGAAGFAMMELGKQRRA